MTRKKDASNTGDIFESTYKDKIAEYDAAIARLRKEIDFYQENTFNKYDSGLGDVEDRNYIRDLEREIDELEILRNQEIQNLSEYQK